MNAQEYALLRKPVLAAVIREESKAGGDKVASRKLFDESGLLCAITGWT